MPACGRQARGFHNFQFHVNFSIFSKVTAMGWDYDVIVVGAGPGGATASRCCAQAGLKTLVIEKERLPRYKVCGGCLSAKTIRLLVST